MFEETFSCNGADNGDWVFDGWELDPFDRTGRKSQSLHGSVGLSQTALLPQTVVKTAAVEFGAAGAEQLTYSRRLRLSTFLGEVSFAVVMNAGREHVIDEQSGTLDQTAWEERHVRLPELAAARVTLGFRVRAHSGMNYMSQAEAWIDDIRVT